MNGPNLQDYDAEGGGATATNKVELCKLDGSREYFATITEGQAAAVAGETLNCYGIFDEYGLGKHGIGYYFPPGAGITRTTQSATAMWRANTANMEFHIGGFGDFISNASGQSCNILDVTGGGAKVGFVARICKSLDYGAFVSSNAAGSEIYADVDRVEASFNAILIAQGSFTGELNTLIATSYSGVFVTGNSTAYVFLDVDSVSAGREALYADNPNSEVYMHVKKLTSTTTDGSNTAIYVGSGEVHLDVLGKATGPGNIVRMDTGQVNNGKLFIEGRLVCTGDNKSPIYLTTASLGSCRVESGSQLIATGTGVAVEAQSGAKDVILNGTVVANADVGAGVSKRVGTLVVDATYVN